VSFPKRRFDVYRDAAAFERRFGRPASADFGRRELVLVAMGPRSSTGYDLRIVRVVERRRSIVVVARERAPALGERVARRLTFPYRLISIPRSDKPVRLKLEGRP
jgi:PrcB C-terminal